MIVIKSSNNLSPELELQVGDMLDITISKTTYSCLVQVDEDDYSVVRLDGRGRIRHIMHHYSRYLEETSLEELARCIVESQSIDAFTLYRASQYSLHLTKD